ncbi:MAG TPA: hypothetical protein VIG48_03585 [Jatrophihabitans sp.]|jgi:hypothetical protein
MLRVAWLVVAADTKISNDSLSPGEKAIVCELRQLASGRFG